MKKGSVEIFAKGEKLFNMRCLGVVFLQGTQQGYVY